MAIEYTFLARDLKEALKDVDDEAEVIIFTPPGTGNTHGRRVENAEYFFNVATQDRDGKKYIGSEFRMHTGYSRY